MIDARWQFVVRFGAPLALGLTALGQNSIQSLGSSSIRAASISPAGDAVAGYGGLSSEMSMWKPSTNLWVGLGDGMSTNPRVSDGGTYACDVIQDVNHPVVSNAETAARWSASTGLWTLLPGLGGVSGTSVSSSYDMSADGQTVVGLAWVNAGEAHAFKWTPSGGTIDIGRYWFPGWGYQSRANGVSADGSVIVGKANGSRATRWSNGTGAYLGSLDPSNPQFGSSEAYGVSPNGQYIVGNSYYRAFLWDATNGMRSLGALGTPGFGNAGYAWGVSDDGRTVVGWSGSNFLNSQAIIWRDGMTQCENLRDYLFQLGIVAAYNDWQELKLASDVSADGTKIVGYGVTVFGNTESFLVDLAPPPPDAYCTAKTNSLGCVPSIGAVGNASASSPAAFNVTCASVLNNRSGLMFYGTAPLANPFQGGYLCVNIPTTRTSIQNSGGSPSGNDCTGLYSFDFRTLIQSGVDTRLIAGADIYTQYWMRDPASVPFTGLSNGLHFRILP
ncbi:MAG: hypothetical protein IT454_03760 [Planctomycetes bacterium]|nr:hypothetical protein [Planctomycetota bacterium]